MKKIGASVLIASTCLIAALSVHALGYALPQEEFEITADDIRNAQPKPSDFKLSDKDKHVISVMEKRHFENTAEFEPEKYRVARLEKHLLGRTWEYLPIDDRMKRLKLASQRRMLAGTSLPVGIRRNFSPDRIANDSTPVYEDDTNVGLIDGLLKLYAPDAYKSWSERKKRMRERYSDE